jgi:predicted  nucleic acid-binding Zn-ribbon protein
MSDLSDALDDLSDSLDSVKAAAEETTEELEVVKESLDKHESFVNDLHYQITELLKVYQKKAFTSLLSEEVEELISKINDWESQIKDFQDEV